MCRRRYQHVVNVVIAVVVALLLVSISKTESFCTRDKSEYFASRITLTTAKYPGLTSLPYCVCVVTMDTASILHVRLHLQSRAPEVTWCQPEIRLGYDDAVTSVCPSLTSNYSLHYEMTKGRNVNVAILNKEEINFKAVVMMNANDGHVIRIGCSAIPDAISPSLLKGQRQSSATRGAQGGIIAGVVVVVIAVIVFVITVTTKIGWNRLKTHVMRQTLTTNMSTTSDKKLSANSPSATKHCNSTPARTQYLLNGKLPGERPRKSDSNSAFDDLDSRSYKGRDYYIDRGYKITITSASGAVRRWDDLEGVELHGFPSRSPSFQFVDRPRIPKRSPSIHSDIETRYLFDPDGSTPRLNRNAILGRHLLPRSPINLYRVNFPIQSQSSQPTRHSAPSITVTGVKTTVAPPAEATKTAKAPVFSLNDDDICFEGDTD